MKVVEYGNLERLLPHGVQEWLGGNLMNISSVALTKRTVAGMV